MSDPEHDDEGQDELDDDDERRRVPSEAFAHIGPSPLPPMGPDGGPMGVGIGSPPPVPPATPDVFVCLRGPCRYYWFLETHLVSGNPKDTWDAEDGLKDEHGAPLRPPRNHTHACTFQPGIDTQFPDDVVYACNQWDPILPADEKRREKRRRVYLKLFPQYRPKE